jgi:hypothetical protein
MIEAVIIGRNSSARAALLWLAVTQRKTAFT